MANVTGSILKNTLLLNIEHYIALKYNFYYLKIDNIYIYFFLLFFKNKKNIRQWITDGTILILRYFKKM